MRIAKWILYAASFTALISVATAVEGYYIRDVHDFGDDTSSLVKMLGEGKAILSNVSLLTADMYLHRGLAHRTCLEREMIVGKRGEHPEHEGDDIALKSKKTGAHKSEYDHDEMDHTEQNEEKLDISKYNILFTIANEVRITKHAHLEGDQLQEIIPWLYYSIKIDPHNILAYTLAGYYLSDRFGKTDDAIRLLRDGVKANPDAWELYNELGRIFFRRKENYRAAIYYLSKAKDIMDVQEHDKFQERAVLTLLALSYERSGYPDEAKVVYKRLHELFPAVKIFKEKSGKAI